MLTENKGFFNLCEQNIFHQKTSLKEELIVSEVVVLASRLSCVPVVSSFVHDSILGSQHRCATLALIGQFIFSCWFPIIVFRWRC